MTREGRPRNLAASIRDRLLNKARTERLDFNLLLTRYALERLIYRLSISEQRDQFLLKGACVALLVGVVVSPGSSERVDHPFQPWLHRRQL